MPWFSRKKSAPPTPQNRPTQQDPPIPPERFPPRLVSLGYEACVINGVEVILPPLCNVRAGEFLMGSDPKQDKGLDDDEKPQHSLTLPAFQIGTFPVSVAEYACFVRAGHAAPSTPMLDWMTQLAHLDHPVVDILWRDTVAYAAWLASLTGQSWRLPTEAEWEKAARWDLMARHARIYPWGDKFDKTRANTSESDMHATTAVWSYPNGTSPCGAQDMAGNVWEWTSSLAKPYPYRQDDGREDPNSTDIRVLRGGSWYSGAKGARAAVRAHYRLSAFMFSGAIGFRLARPTV